MEEEKFTFEAALVASNSSFNSFSLKEAFCGQISLGNSISFKSLFSMYFSTSDCLTLTIFKSYITT